MKRKDVLLDFTPLLDVTLILLFFFLLFSTFEVEEAKIKLNNQIEAAEQQMQEANSLAEQLKEDLEIVENASNRQASNIEALLEFNRSANVKLILSMKGGNATVKISQGDTIIATTTPDGDLAGIICTALKNAGYTENDTVLCEFILNGSEPGTKIAYQKIKQNLMYVKADFNYFYYSETDISIGED
ncbi:MAG: biopolymer transporter ExbD [Oscillospiraceae bacterium]|nr:biopolymer transporter ExbD [Oscillospiraceae bacterium]